MDHASNIEDQFIGHPFRDHDNLPYSISSVNQNTVPVVLIKKDHHRNTHRKIVSFKKSANSDNRKAGAKNSTDFSKIIGRNRKMKDVFQEIVDVADSIQLPDDVSPGTCTLSIAVVGEEDSEPVVQLGIEGRSEDGWYSLSTVTVSR